MLNKCSLFESRVKSDIDLVIEKTYERTPDVKYWRYETNELFLMMVCDEYSDRFNNMLILESEGRLRITRYGINGNLSISSIFGQYSIPFTDISRQYMFKTGDKTVKSHYRMIEIYFKKVAQKQEIWDYFKEIKKSKLYQSLMVELCKNTRGIFGTEHNVHGISAYEENSIFDLVDEVVEVLCESKDKIVKLKDLNISMFLQITK